MGSWCTDRFGISWQTVQRVLMDAMMTMKKIDIATIEAARRGEHAKRKRV